MKAVITILFLKVSIIFGQPVGEGSLLSRLGEMDSTVIYLAVLTSPQLHNYFPASDFGKYYDRETHTIVQKVTPSGSTLANELINVFRQSSGKKEILEILNVWITSNHELDKMQKKSEIQMEQVFFNAASTKPLVQKFLRDPRQTWESLSSFQSYELYIDFMNFCECLNQIHRKLLFEELAKTAKQFDSH